MIPSLFFPLAALPLTKSGKVDRLALARLELPGAGSGEEGSEPATKAEKVLADLWRELLATQQLRLEDNFFELGGDSILGVRLASRAAAVGLELTPLMLLENQTLGELAAVAREIPLEEPESAVDEAAELDPDEVLTEVSLDQAQLAKILGKFG
jgi:aryl carrier-like protein